jgi:alpha-amylase/alpha-mannosidase (GH57 family)
MAEIALALFWHQHQPYYPDDVAKENPMPWVRLHGVKDYWGMALHLFEYPAMRCTINLVPSLLVQLQAYTERGASDRFLDVTRIPAADLAEADALFLLDHFFMANHEQMIRPYPRYAELFQRRGAGRNTAKEALRRFNERDLRDLQVWFNLTWIHPFAFDRDPELRGLRDKGRNFTEADKTHVIDKQFEILRDVIPLHRKLAESGQIELTTTPFFHPILPLLLDKKLAREAMPDVKLPRYTGGYPEDAAVHVKRAMEQHAQMFGAPPRGMWPAEGSVCQPMIPLLAEHGVRWIATDEEVLGGSTQGFVSRDGKGHVNNPEHLYRPYKVAEGGKELNIVFRDHALSDMIGFHYQHSEPVAAANDFVSHLLAIGKAINGGTALVTVILDGENCWESYPGGGVPFLRALYEKCTRTPGIRPVRIGDYVESHPPRDTLPHLFAGSWISHNFSIWIGHEEDVTAWDALHRTREHLRQRAAQEHMPQDRVRQAWEEIYIAEGSDWFWWYGDDHSSAQDALFDYLFRKHLQNVYTLLGDTPPPDLARPIMRRGQRPTYTLPRCFLDVKVDGKRTFLQWLGAGKYVCQNERGTMAMVARGPLKEVHFGFNLKELLVRVDFETSARTALNGFDSIHVGFLEPAGYDVFVHRAPGDAVPPRWQPAQLLHNGQPVESAGIQVGVDQILEMSIPFAGLGVKVDQPVHFFVELLESRQSRDRAPREGTINLTVPSPHFEQIMWDV